MVLKYQVVEVKRQPDALREKSMHMKYFFDDTSLVLDSKEVTGEGEQLQVHSRDGKDEWNRDKAQEKQDNNKDNDWVIVKPDIKRGRKHGKNSECSNRV